MAIWQVAIKQLVAGQECRNVWHYRSVGDSLTAGDLTDLADTIRAGFAGQGAGNIPNDWQIYGITVRRVDEAGWPGTEVGFTSGPFVGTATNDTLPTQVALLTHGTVMAQQPNRVRTYHTGLAENHCVDGVWTTAIRSQKLLVDTTLASINLVDAGEIVRVAVKWDPTRSYVVDSNDITTWFSSSIPATQRRRRIGRGQ